MKKIVFIDTYYFDVLKTLNIDHVNHNGLKYHEKILEVEGFGFGTGASYVRSFRKAGWDAQIIIPNAMGLQYAWCQEYSNIKPIKFGWKYMQAISRLPFIPKICELLPMFYKVLIEQIRFIKPDVIFVQDLHCLHPVFVNKLKKISPLVYGEIASPLPPNRFLRPYSRIFSALPTIVSKSKILGISSTYLPLAFDSAFSENVRKLDRKHDVVFVGTFGRHQPKTIPLLQAIAAQIPTLEIYGIVDQDILRESGLSSFYKGEVWGIQMFELLRDSKIVINRHGTIAGEYAVNMRMYEATGSGALLVTENAINLNELFQIDKEVIAYNSPEDAAKKIAEILNDTKRLESISLSGHNRTMSAHTYDHRVEKILEILSSD